MGRRTAGGLVQSHDRCLHLRPWPGGAESAAMCNQVLSERGGVMSSQTQDVAAQAQSIHCTLDGQDIEALPDETIWQAARRNGVNVPHLSYKPEQVGVRADGNCRVCMVEIEGEGPLAPSCWRQPKEGMEVRSQSERAQHSQKMVLELLEADTPDTAYYIPNSGLSYWSKVLGV